MVADWGGVFSPRMLCWCGLRTVGRMMGVVLGPGRGLVTRDFSSLSSGLESMNGSRLWLLLGVDGLSVFSGERGVDELESRPLSIM